MTTYHVIQGGQSGNAGDGNLSSKPYRPRSVNFATIVSEANALVADDLAKLLESAPLGADSMPRQDYVEFNQGMLIGAAMKAVVRRYDERSISVQHKGYVLTVADMHLQHARDLVSGGFGSFGMNAAIDTSLTDIHKMRQGEGLEQALGGGFQVSGGCPFELDLNAEGGMAIHGNAITTGKALEGLRARQTEYENQFLDQLSGRDPKYRQILERAQTQPEKITLEDVFRACPVQYIVPRGSNDIYEVDVAGTMSGIMSAFAHLPLLQGQAEAELKRLAQDPEHKQDLARMRSEELLGVKSGIALPPGEDAAPDEF